MRKEGEKGKCLTCPHFYKGSAEVNAWCLAKNMRLIYQIKDLQLEPKMRIKDLKIKYEGQLDAILKTRINPSWCPLRKDEF